MRASEQSPIDAPERVTDATGDQASGPRTRLLGWLALALTVGPLLLSALHLVFVVGGDYRPLGDLALTEMYVRDVGRHQLLVGPYSRDGWFHPGPALYYVLVLPYRLLASSSVALPVAALLINGGSVVGMALIARRRGGLPLMLCTLVACSLLLRALGYEFLRLPWNPWLTVLPYGLLVFLTWELLAVGWASLSGRDPAGGAAPGGASASRSRSVWALPLAVGVASFLAQTHVAYVPLALPLLALGAAALLAPPLHDLYRRRTRPAADADADAAEAATTTTGADQATAASDAVNAAIAGPPDDGEGDGDGRGERAEGTNTAGTDAGGVGRRWRALSPALLIALVVGGVMWLPPLYQQITGEPGNLRRIGRYFRHAEGTHSLADGWRVVSAQYGPSPEWLTGASDTTFLQEPVYLLSPVVPVLLIPVVLAAIVLWRRGGASARALVGLWLVASVVGLVATARTVGLIYAYRLGWAWVLGMVGGLLVLWAAWDLLARWRDGRAAGRVLVAGAVVTLAGLAVVNGVGALTAGTPHGDESRIVGTLARAVRDRLPSGDGDVVIISTSFGALHYGAGLRLDLERHGIPVKVPDGEHLHGRARSYHGGPARARLLVAVDSDVVSFLRRPDLDLIAYTGSVSRTRLIESAEQQAALEVRFEAGELDPDEYFRRLQRVTPTGPAVAVFAEPEPPAS